VEVVKVGPFRRLIGFILYVIHDTCDLAAQFTAG
jgi:hypothetical protein